MPKPYEAFILVPAGVPVWERVMAALGDSYGLDVLLGDVERMSGHHTSKMMLAIALHRFTTTYAAASTADRARWERDCFAWLEQHFELPPGAIGHPHPGGRARRRSARPTPARRRKAA